MIFLYEILINVYESSLDLESEERIEKIIRRLIGTAKREFRLSYSVILKPHKMYIQLIIENTY